jgi:hypothetical protein
LGVHPSFFKVVVHCPCAALGVMVWCIGFVGERTGLALHLGHGVVHWCCPRADWFSAALGSRCGALVLSESGLV